MERANDEGGKQKPAKDIEDDSQLAMAIFWPCDVNHRRREGKVGAVGVRRVATRCSFPDRDTLVTCPIEIESP